MSDHYRTIASRVEFRQKIERSEFLGIAFPTPSEVAFLRDLAAIEKELMVDGLVLRYRTKTGVDGLPAGEGVFLPCSFWLAAAQIRGYRAGNA